MKVAFPRQTKLTAYSGTQIPQHGVCSIKCSYGDKATDAEFYAADVAGSAILWPTHLLPTLLGGVTLCSMHMF